MACSFLLCDGVVYGEVNGVVYVSVYSAVYVSVK